MLMVGRQAVRKVTGVPVRWSRRHRNGETTTRPTPILILADQLIPDAGGPRMQLLFADDICSTELVRQPQLA